MICTRTLVAQKHHACKSENKYCGLLSVWHALPPPISKYFDSQGMAASRAAHLPHILRASRQVTAAARQNAACRRVFCALGPLWKKNQHGNNTVIISLCCIQIMLCSRQTFCELCTWNMAEIYLKHSTQARRSTAPEKLNLRDLLCL